MPSTSRAKRRASASILSRNCCRTRSTARPAACALAPGDVQAIKACGVTFAVSLLERVIEEQAGGDAAKAREVRETINNLIGADLSKIEPGSESAIKLKAEPERRGAWSQYMEVGIGPDAEVFSKSQPMSSVGFGAEVDLYPTSQWNNPEPEIVLAVNADGKIVGATLGNDVNLRDIEGRSALLLGKAKQQRLVLDRPVRAPVRRALHARYRARREPVAEDRGRGRRLRARRREPHERDQPRSGRSRVPDAWPVYQYPDGFVLFLGTMFSPIKDRDTPGGGFTHHLGNVVTISTPTLGALVNTVRLSTEIAPWTFGVRALYANLARRGMVGAG